MFAPALEGLGTPAFRSLVIRVGAFAKATIVLEHLGSAVLASSVVLLVGDGARVDLAGLQLWDDDAVHAGHLGIRVGRDAHVRTLTASLGGDLVRLVQTAEYAGPGGEIEQLGLAKGANVEKGYVTRVPKAYPMYDADYGERVAVIKEWLAGIANIQQVGRNGEPHV